MTTGSQKADQEAVLSGPGDNFSTDAESSFVGVLAGSLLEGGVRGGEGGVEASKMERRGRGRVRKGVENEEDSSSESSSSSGSSSDYSSSTSDDQEERRRALERNTSLGKTENGTAVSAWMSKRDSIDVDREPKETESRSENGEKKASTAGASLSLSEEKRESYPDVTSPLSEKSPMLLKPRTGMSYQLVFGMDEDSEASVSSPLDRSEEASTILASLASHEQMPGSHDPSGDRGSRDTDVIELPDSSVSVGGSIQSDASSVVTSNSIAALENSEGNDRQPAEGKREKEGEGKREGEREGEGERESVEEVDEGGGSPEKEKDGWKDILMRRGSSPEEPVKSKLSDRSGERDSQSGTTGGVVSLDNITLQPYSPVSLTPATPPSVTTSPKPKPAPRYHPLSIDTSDSEVEDPETPPFSPMDEISDPTLGRLALLPPSPLPPGLDSPSPLDDQPAMSILFSGVSYLGSSSVDAPVSENEANRKMTVLKQQASLSEPIPIVLSIPTCNEGSVYLQDPDTEQPLTAFPVKMILFCCRGHDEDMQDCFCLNVRHKRGGIYHCHVFRCEIVEAVSV